MTSLIKLFYPIYSLSRVGFDKLIQKLDAVYNGEYSKVERVYRAHELNFLDMVNYFIGEPSLIIDNIYVGSAYNASDWYSLQERGIQSIINVSDELTNYFDDCIDYMRINILDNDEAVFGDFFEKAYYFIDNCVANNKPLLIHCYMGSSRSVSIMVYYLMRKHNKKLVDALSLIRSKRGVVNLNKAFYKELSNAESKIIEYRLIKNFSF
tara:strand:+ start:891 stop:1517 length:627 start_codon:yes stop_codon:yes gene_type:complete